MEAHARLDRVFKQVVGPGDFAISPNRNCLRGCSCERARSWASVSASFSAGFGGDDDYTIHKLRPNARNYTFDASQPAAVRVKSGDVIEVQCLDASDGWLQPTGTGATTAHYAKRRHTPEIMARFPGNPNCEPVYVEGAEPGDNLHVELLELRSETWGWTGVRRGFGLLAGDQLFPDDRLQIWQLHPDTRAPCEFGDTGIKVPYRPFCGCMGVAPPPGEVWEEGQEPGVVTIGPPNIAGGNIDTKHLVEGSTVRLPVFVPGALFSLGDGHAAQGDGEVCGSAIECHMWVRWPV